MFRAFLGILAIVCCSFFTPQQTDTDKLVMKAAEGQLDAFVGKIQPGDAKDHGFKESDDLENCGITKPYRIITFNADFYAGPLTEGTNYITIKNEWRVPVTVKGEHRVLLTVNGQSGNYKVSAMGYPELAKELEIKSAAYSENDGYYLLHIAVLNADFFVSEKENSFAEAEFVALESAKTAIPFLRTSAGAKPTYTLDEVQAMVKTAVEQKTAKKEPEPKKGKKKSSKK
ncbi:MAG: hypothetical protein K0Q79_1160 [Flavipsychrobacter sp.]|jgi:hypothetical protein|nr:hypothetical protein [Flavipsychrobacter sp.]